MHLVIMAAGEGSRMRPFTDTTPKPLIQICGKTIIDHKIDPIIELLRQHDFISLLSSSSPFYHGVDRVLQMT